MIKFGVCIFFLIPFFTSAQLGEEVGSATYYFENSTSDTLLVNYVLVGQLGGAEQTIVSPPGAKTLLIEDSIFGVNPMPKDTFQSVAILNKHGEIVVKDDIKNISRWRYEKDNGYASTYYHSNYYLLIE